MRVLSKYAFALELLLLSVVMPLGSVSFAKSIKIEGGSLQGTTEDGLRVYRGIPYAAPPVGDLRWRAPQPPPKWKGVRAADQFGRPCMQTNAAIANLPAPSEDCLYLNVWTRVLRTNCRFWCGFMVGASLQANPPRSSITAGGWPRKM